ncbi:MAG: histidine phosphatase family protein [Rhodospirillales bacterium]|nr:histidine phosphatase family protein [Rhodospirillales bacterium]
MGCLARGRPRGAHAAHGRPWRGRRPPPGFKLEECATQRNLSPKGRADAITVGEKFRAERVPVGKVVNSPWCRCVDTATLMNVGAIEIDATFSNAFVLSDRRAQLADGARAVIRSWKGPGALLVSTHGANIAALTGGTNPDSGEIVVVKGGAGATFQEIGRIPPPK